MNKKLRLLVTKKCNRNCPGCCNKQYDIKNLPVATDFCSYEEIMITGGEPVLFLGQVDRLVRAIRLLNSVCGGSIPKIYIYTALTQLESIADALDLSDGITFTLHSQEDAIWLSGYSHLLKSYQGRSVRLNVFEGIKLSEKIIQSGCQINYKTWQKECPIPEGEDFKRLPKLFE